MPISVGPILKRLRERNRLTQQNVVEWSSPDYVDRRLSSL